MMIARTELRKPTGRLLTVALAVILLLMSAGTRAIPAAAEGKGRVTYSVYPYLPDAHYYAEVLEAEWSERHPDVRLEYVPYDCYFGGRPEGIDVIMYDVIMERAFVEKGYLRPLDVRDRIDTGDYYPFTLEKAAGYAENYGVPVFLCCDLLIYDGNNRELSAAEDIFDVAASESKALISFAAYGDHVYLLDAAVDMTQDAQVIQSKDRLGGIDVAASKAALAAAAIGEYTDTDGNALAALYDAGVADGYIGYAETLRFLEHRLEDTEVKQISVGKSANIPLFYCDMAGISADVPDARIGLCMDLIEIMTDTEVMQRVSVKDGAPQYLMFPRVSFYEAMQNEYPMYAKLRTVAENPDNRLFRAYGSFMEETYGN